MLWKVALPAAGAACLLYYGAVSLRLHRWNSTFARFWLAAGALCAALLVLFRLRPELSESPLWKLLWIPAAAFAAVEMLIAGGMVSTEEKGIPYLIVLGAQVKGTKITDSLRRRLRRSAAYLSENPETMVIVSGGQGPGEAISEAEAMAAYLIGCGIRRSRILLEDQSKSTEENLTFSARYLPDKNVKVGIVSNNFHMYRACLYARKIGYKDVCRIPAGCSPLLFVNYMVREFFAVCRLWLP
ncbi:YdcF family protein [Extibacter muris]|uniref:YdcF family protein n=1 Tax=Extibacter muris TaxID=1796622 RepID=UPI001D0807E4|nr:YdcF family protein [Extibacter muris]MCB6202713.1 YdcF family protein [Extibacter muris]MCQ4664491.1 YdcF family protein [Extibacter muris]MCQ4693700.1 YdcF family protein [Extibacter muris]